MKTVLEAQAEFPCTKDDKALCKLRIRGDTSFVCIYDPAKCQYKRPKPEEAK